MQPWTEVDCYKKNKQVNYGTNLGSFTLKLHQTGVITNSLSFLLKKLFYNHQVSLFSM